MVDDMNGAVDSDDYYLRLVNEGKVLKITDGRGLIVREERCKRYLQGTGKSLEDIKEFFDVEYDCGYFAGICQTVGSIFNWTRVLKTRKGELKSDELGWLDG